MCIQVSISILLCKKNLKYFCIVSINMFSRYLTQLNKEKLINYINLKKTSITVTKYKQFGL